MLPLTRAGFNDPQLLEDFERLRQKNVSLRHRAKDFKVAADGMVAAEAKKTKAAVEKAEKLALDLEASERARLHEVEALKEELARAKEDGRRLGQEGYLQSKEGLGVIESVRRAAEKHMLRSDAFVCAVAEVIPFYGNVFLERSKARLASDGSLDGFCIEEEMGDLPDHELLKLGPEDLAVTELDTSAFLQLATSRPVEDWLLPKEDLAGTEGFVEEVLEGIASPASEGVRELPMPDRLATDSELNEQALHEMLSNPDRVHSLSEGLSSQPLEPSTHA